jgi:hypothetical protein
VAGTLELARVADRLGYRRYWLAEHHSSQGLAGTVPEILIARIAAETRDIRVGSGGVMLSHYAPLEVAETFRMLETLYPGRIDLGIGRAPRQRSAHRQRTAVRAGRARYRPFPGADRGADGISRRRAAGQPSVRGAPCHADGRGNTRVLAARLELVVVSICFDFAARLRSYELLAEAFELAGQS